MIGKDKLGPSCFATKQHVEAPCWNASNAASFGSQRPLTSSWHKGCAQGRRYMEALNTKEKDHGLSPPKGVTYGGANTNCTSRTKRRGTVEFCSARAVAISLEKINRLEGLVNHAKTVQRADTAK